jgi:hypothetical protein
VQARCPGANADAAKRTAFVRRHGIDCVRNFLADTSDINQQVLPCCRRLGPASDAFDQPNAELPFKLLELKADCRLGKIGLLRGGRKAAKIDNVGEGHQLLEAELPHQSFPYGFHQNHKL